MSEARPENMSGARPENLSGDESDLAGPTMRILAGDPTDEEIAALVAVIAARASAGGAAPERPSTPVSGWAAHWRNTNGPQPPGRDGWKTSGLPR